MREFFLRRTPIYKIEACVNFRLEEGGKEALTCANIRDRYARHILQTLVHGVVVQFHTVLCRDGSRYRIHQEPPLRKSIRQIDFPELVLNSVLNSPRDGKLVVPAGADLSMGSPLVSIIREIPHSVWLRLQGYGHAFAPCQY